MRLRPFLASLFCLVLLWACGGGGGGARSVPSGTLTLRFGSDSFPGYAQAVVSLEKVEASSDGVTWIQLGSVRATFDLMQLQGGHSAVIVPAARVDAGTYTQFRLTWAAVNYQSESRQPAYLVLEGGVERFLSMPATTLVGGSVTVTAGGTTTAQVMLSGQQAVQVRSGLAAPYVFQATGRVHDTAATARITGSLLDGTTPLAGAEVFAETVDGTGLATLQRRAFTDAAGTYTLEGLPTGSLYFVVSQPAAAASAYAAAAAAPVNATAATTYTANLAFGAPQTPGALTLTITPASSPSQGTWGELRQTLATGSGSQTLVVRSQTVATGVAQDQAGFTGLAPGTYGVTVQRSTSGGTPVMKTGTQVLVSAGATATSTVSLP